MTTTPKAAKEAMAAQDGACNPRALVFALSTLMRIDYRDADTPTLTGDPALRLITHQLAYLMGAWTLDNTEDDYAGATRACKSVLARAGGYITRADLEDSGIAFDGALPQSWLNAAVDATGQNPCGHVVWAYPDGMIGGEPRAVSETGAAILSQFE